MLWEQRLGRRLLLDHPDHHPASVLLRWLGRQQQRLRLWLLLQQWLRLRLQRRLLLNEATWKAGLCPAFRFLKTGQAFCFGEQDIYRPVMGFSGKDGK